MTALFTLVAHRQHVMSRAAGEDNFPGNWALWLEAAGVAGEKVKLGGGFDLASNMIVAASSGMGVAVVQTCLVERELSTGELVRPFALTASTGRGYYVCTRKSVAPDSPAGLFRAWVQGVARADAA